MLFRRLVLTFLSLGAATTAAAAADELELSKNGGVCETSADCEGNLDCTSVGMFQSKRCFPVTCAKGAAAAIMAEGFKADQFLATVRSKAGIKSDREFLTLDETGNNNLMKAIGDTRPPMDVFNANMTACLHPERSEQTRNLQIFGGIDDEEEFLTPEAAYGLQWGAAALFSYYGKSTWWTKEDVIETDPGEFDGDFNFQQISTCVGALLGGDIGVDVLFQIPDERYYKLLLEDIFNEGDPFDSSEPGGLEFRKNVDNTQYIPVFVAGPIGVSVGWDQENGPESGTITEVTLGASFGAALMGFSQCYNHIYVSFPFF